MRPTTTPGSRSSNSKAESQRKPAPPCPQRASFAAGIAPLGLEDVEVHVVAHIAACGGLVGLEIPRRVRPLAQRLIDCEAAQGLNADRRRKQLIGFALAGSNFGACSHRAEDCRWEPRKRLKGDWHALGRDP